MHAISRLAILTAAVTATVTGCDDRQPDRPQQPRGGEAPLYDPTSLSLSAEVIPEPSNLDEFVKDRDAAVRLGKALFWDMAVGSDGVTACASCHSHGGADGRAINQLNPGTNNGNETFTLHSANHPLSAEDFPFRQLADPDVRDSEVIADTQNIAGSQGVVKKTLVGLLLPFYPFFGIELGATVPDPLFQVDGENVRQVTPRNAPSVINAVFNFRQLWDGRANPIFNGVSPFGPRDEDARVYQTTDGSLEAIVVEIDNASLASQAVGPVRDTAEMSFDGRTWPLVGRKLIPRRALRHQQVSPNDSVLGDFVAQGSSHHSPLKGLEDSYDEMIRDAFHDKWWNATDDCVSFADAAATVASCADGPAQTSFSHMEVNFSLFFGVAIQMYEATLVSDDAPIDHYAQGDADALTDSQKLGLELFMGEAQCSTCHAPPVFTDATVRFAEESSPIREVPFPIGAAHLDRGFHNTGVRPTGEDMGVGGTDPFGLPLSVTQSSQQGIDVGYPVPPIGPDEFVAQHIGNMKTSILRNVELSGPYLHTGGQATLRQVVDFYNRGGDFNPLEGILDGGVILPLQLTQTEKQALVDFMLALTDPRVVNQSAPFDHPQLFIVEGGELGDGVTNITEVPAVGAAGGEPLSTFLGLDPQQP